MLVRAVLAASMSQYLVDQLSRQANVRVETEVEVTGVQGTSTLEAIEVRRVGGAPRASAERWPVRADRRRAGDAWLPPR